MDAEQMKVLPITGLILAGGKNRRMSGRMKFFLPLEGENFAQRILAALKDAGGLKEVYLSVSFGMLLQNEKLPEGQDPGEQVPKQSEQEKTEQATPLRKTSEQEKTEQATPVRKTSEQAMQEHRQQVQARLHSLGLPMIVDEYEAIGPMGGILSGLHVLPGQALLVISSDSPFITSAMIRKLIDAFVQNPVLTLASCDGRIQPLLGIYPPEVQDCMEELVEMENYRMKSLLDRTDYQIVEIDPKAAININTPGEYQKYCGGSIY